MGPVNSIQKTVDLAQMKYECLEEYSGQSRVQSSLFEVRKFPGSECPCSQTRREKGERFPNFLFDSRGSQKFKSVEAC